MKKQIYDKIYFERYAKCNLVTNYCNDYKKLRKLEKPDFQSKKLNTGIEVTKAIPTEEGRALSIINKYFGKKYNGKFIKNEIENKYKGDFKNNIGVIDGVAYYKREYNREEKKNEIEERIEVKLHRLNDNYKLFENNHLYIFSETSLIEKETLEIIMEDIKEISLKYKFDIIFVNAIDCIYIMDFNKNTIEKVEISAEDNIKCIRYAETEPAQRPRKENYIYKI